MDDGDLLASHPDPFIQITEPSAGQASYHIGISNVDNPTASPKRNLDDHSEPNKESSGAPSRPSLCAPRDLSPNTLSVTNTPRGAIPFRSMNRLAKGGDSAVTVNFDRQNQIEAGAPGGG